MENERFSWYWTLFCWDPDPYRFCLDPDPFQSSVRRQFRNEFFRSWIWIRIMVIRIRNTAHHDHGHCQRLPPKTSTKDLNQGPPPKTFTKDLHQRPLSKTFTKDLHQRPLLKTFTKDLHQRPLSKDLHQRPQSKSSSWDLRYGHRQRPPHPDSLDKSLKWENLGLREASRMDSEPV